MTDPRSRPPIGRSAAISKICERKSLAAASRQLDFESEAGGSALLAASRNQARKMYHDELPVSAGIGNAIGSAARTPRIARQKEMTNRAMFGARNIMAALLSLGFGMIATISGDL